MYSDTYICIHWTFGAACASTQPDHSLRYVMCVLCIVKDMRLLHAATEGQLDWADAQAYLSEHVNCRICCARAQMIWTVINANNVDPDQTPGSVASDLGLHCLSVFILWEASNNTACTNTHTALSNDWSACTKQWPWSSCTSIVPSNDPEHPAQIPIQR